VFSELCNDYLVFSFVSYLIYFGLMFFSLVCVIFDLFWFDVFFSS
jgi:hypothetical protein